MEYKNKANKLLISGFLIWMLGNMLKLKRATDAQNLQFFLGYVLFLLGVGLFIYGCVNYTKAKGYKWYLGLLGMLNLIGLIILVLLPDKNKD